MFPKSNEKTFLTHKPAESLAEKKGQEKNYVTRKWKNVIYVVIRVLGCTSVNVKMQVVLLFSSCRAASQTESKLLVRNNKEDKKKG